MKSFSFADIALALLTAFAMTVVGCGSNETQVADAPAPTAATPPPQPVDAGDSGLNDASMDSSNADSGSGEDPGTSAETTDEPPDSSSAPDAPMKDTDTTTMTDAGMDDTGTAPQPKAAPKSFKEQAEIAFSTGREAAAIRLLQAHLLTTPEDAEPILSQYRWSPMRKQPQLIARIAVGADITNPYADVTKDKYGPIGSLKVQTRAKTKRIRGDTEPISDSAEAGTSGPRVFTANNKERILQRYAGLMGDGLVDHIRETHAKGFWSPYFHANNGVVATTSQAVGGFDSTSDSSTDFAGEMAASSSSQSKELSTSISPAEAKQISLGPILTFIGRDSTAKLVEQAKQGGFDALVVFDIDINVNLKQKMIYNECQAKLMNWTDTKPLAISKSLKNTEVQKEIDASGMSVIMKAMQPINSMLDEKVALVEVPGALTVDLIKTKRLPVLIEDSSRSKLDRLAELRFYQSKNLLSDADIYDAFKAILGADDAGKLLNGSAEDRRSVGLNLLDAPKS